MRTADRPRTPVCGPYAVLKVQTPTGSNPSPTVPHTYPQVPQPTLLGARESDETTLPLLNRVILLSFAHVTDNEHADLRI